MEARVKTWTIRLMGPPLGVGVDPREHDARNEAAVAEMNDKIGGAEVYLNDATPDGYYVKIDE